MLVQCLAKESICCVVVRLNVEARPVTVSMVLELAWLGCVSPFSLVAFSSSFDCMALASLR